MITIIAILSPVLAMVGMYFFERRVKRIRKEQATYAEVTNTPDYEDEIGTENGFKYGKKSSVDDRLIDTDKRWNDPMA